jgi:hypothetical protein
MKTFKVATAFLTSLTIVSLSVLPMAASAQTSQEQNQATALMRGYRTGYSDGYQEGVADIQQKCESASFAVRVNTIRPTALSIPPGAPSKSIAMVTGRIRSRL